jgi:tetratricopeptide (TPR) repeat protein
MAIVDPSALPETAEACTEYITEADHAWDGGDNDHARVLYHSVVESAVHSDDQRSHAAYRLALIAMNAGDKDAAWEWAATSHEAGAADLMHVIANATPQDAPDPNVIPQTPEASDAYWELGRKAKAAGDWATAVSWFAAVVAGPGESDVLARARVNLAICYHAQGQDDIARAWLEDALPMLDNSIMDDVDLARQLFEDLGVHVHEEAGASPATHQLNAGIEAYQLGDAAAARAALEAAMHVEGTTDEIKGKASFYLGTMDRQAASYAEARDRLERAAELAPEPERSWAAQLLAEKWDEQV